MALLLGLLGVLGGGLAASRLVPSSAMPTPAPLSGAMPVSATSRPDQPPSAPPTHRQVVICVDPGHPSENGSGAVAADGLHEVEANWQVALVLRDLLVKRGAKVVMTKASRDEQVANRRRAEIANAARADLCVRLHCDANHGQGHTVYYPAQPGHAQGHEGPSREVREASARAADTLADALKAGLGDALVANGVKTDRETAIGRRQGALTGSVFSQVPVVTVEMVDLTHAADASWMRAADHRRQMASALADGVMRFAQASR